MDLNRGDKKKMNSKTKIFAVLALVLAASMFVSGIMVGSQVTPKVPSVSEKVPNIIGTISVVVCNGQTGEVLYNETSTKLDPLTNGGSSYLIGAMTNTSFDTAGNKVLNMGLSNDSTPLVTWLTQPNLIAANGLSIATGLTATIGWCTTSSGASQYFTVNHTWTCATANENQVQCAGLYWVATGASGLICANTFSPACNLGYANSDTIQVTYNVTMPCG